MKINPKLRTRVILLFFFIYTVSVFVFDIYIFRSLNSEAKILKRLNLEEKIYELKTQSNQKEISNILSEYLKTLANIKSQRVKTAVFSSLILFFITLLSMSLFLYLVIKMTNPFEELKIAAAQISNGNFDIKLKETGYPEIIALKTSFNLMTKRLKALQIQLIEEEKNKIWKDFSKILAHEIKNPLTPIKLTLERLEANYYTNQKKFVDIFPESLSIIYQEIENLNFIAKSFSDFAKNYQPDFKSIKLCYFIKNIIYPYLSVQNIELICKKKDLTIIFDERHLYQIITNLIQNAIDFSEGKKILIKINNDDDKIKISIIDFGKGIKEEDKDKIFLPYFSKKKKGLGLGLAIVKRLVEINNADIEVSKNLPKGTVFTIIKNRVKL